MKSTDADGVTLIAGVVGCTCGQPSPCESLRAAIVEHVFVRDDRHHWLLNAAIRMHNAMQDDGFADRVDFQPHTWQWLRAIDLVVTSEGVVESLVTSMWALDRHDEVADWDRGEDLPYELADAAAQLAAMTGLWLALDRRVACLAVLPAAGRRLLACHELGGWPRHAAAFDAELARFVAGIR